jgi:hypothetical protein
MRGTGIDAVTSTLINAHHIKTASRKALFDMVRTLLPRPDSGVARRRSAVDAGIRGFE